MSTCSNLDCNNKVFNTKYRCSRCRHDRKYNCAVCGTDLPLNIRVFCKDCIWIKNSEKWKKHHNYKCKICNKHLSKNHTKTCSKECSYKLTYISGNKYYIKRKTVKVFSKIKPNLGVYLGT